MNSYRSLAALVLAFILCSCASPGSKLSKIAVGMTKEQVIDILGPPTSTTAVGGVETLNYSANAGRMWSYDFDDYVVRLVNGKVESYGRRADLKDAPARQ